MNVDPAPAGVSEQRLDEIARYNYPNPEWRDIQNALQELQRARALLREQGALLETAAVTAWSTGMDLWNKDCKQKYDSREVGSACATAIRKLIEAGK